MNTEPSRLLRDLLNSFTNYDIPFPGRIRVTETAESDIKSDDLVNPIAVTSSDNEW